MNIQLSLKLFVCFCVCAVGTIIIKLRVIYVQIEFFVCLFVCCKKRIKTSRCEERKVQIVFKTRLIRFIFANWLIAFSEKKKLNQNFCTNIFWNTDEIYRLHLLFPKNCALWITFKNHKKKYNKKPYFTDHMNESARINNIIVI